MGLFRKLWFIILLVAVIGIGFVVAGEMNLIPGLNFNIFGKREIKIADTPLEIKDIKEIGELICSEFYGEVYADLNDAYIKVLKEYNAHLEKNGDTMGSYKDSMLTAFPLLEELLEKQDKIKEWTEEFTKKSEQFKIVSTKYQLAKVQFDSIQIQYDSITLAFETGQTQFEENKKTYKKALDELDEQEKEISKKIKKLKRNENESEREQLQESLASVQDNIKRYNDLITENVDKQKMRERDKKEMNERYGDKKKDFSRLEKEYNSEESDYNRAKDNFESKMKRETTADKNIVYIGRGWVKAGFDLNKITAEDFVVGTGADSSTMTIRVYPPQILVADINPWFIKTEKNQVEGYELFMKKGNERSFTNEEQTKVKAVCKDKLREEAIKKGIMKNAEEAGEEVLKQFFTLLGFENIIIEYKTNDATK